MPDFATLLGIADVARSKNLPKLKIIPLDAIPKFKLDLPKESGVIGVLSDYVHCNPSHSALKTFLFGNVVLADSRDSAYRISKLGHKAVTLDGEYRFVGAGFDKVRLQPGAIFVEQLFC